MKTKSPLIRQTSWTAAILQFGLLTIFIVAHYYLFNPELFAMSMVFGAALYLILSLGLRLPLTRNQTKGMRLLKKNDFENGLKEFEKSALFFKKYRWIDKYRCLVMFCASQLSYLEMALVNQAHCHFRLGNVPKAKELYHETLKLFPHSAIAQLSLEFIETVENHDK